VSTAARASVVVPVLDQRLDWLARCVHSALEQTVPTDVHVVFSARTPAAQVAWLRNLAGEHPRLHPALEQRPGFAAAINTGIAASATERVGLLLSDDWLEPTAVAECLPVRADIVSTGLTTYATDGRTCLEEVSRTPSQAEFERRSTLESKASYLEHFFLFRRAALLAAGGVDETVGLTGCDDYDLIWTLLERGATVAVLPRRLYNYRDHSEARLSLRSRPAQCEDLARILDKHRVHGAERARIMADHANWFGEPVHLVARRRALLRRLGPDLAALVAAAPAALVDAEPLSACATSARATFRLGFADGGTRKGRVLQTERQAATVARWAPELPTGSVARVLACHGRALIEEWIPGTPLDQAPDVAGHLRPCGRLLAMIHAGAPVEARPTGDAEPRAGLLALVERRALEPAIAEHAERLARRCAPARASRGRCHGDFAAENIVLRPDGALCLIDNETLDLGPLDYDLARAWYRWPMPPEVWDELLAGYGEVRSAADFRAHFPYWAVRVLVDAARYRLDARHAEADVPLRRLRALVESGP
jgi:GT2 family glycosyltransferase